MKKQPEQMVSTLFQNYKCLTVELPQVDIAIFDQDTKNSIVFRTWQQEEQRPESESGYIGTGKGDSGSPRTITTEDDLSRAEK